MCGVQFDCKLSQRNTLAAHYGLYICTEVLVGIHLHVPMVSNKLTQIKQAAARVRIDLQGTTKTELRLAFTQRKTQMASNKCKINLHVDTSPLLLFTKLLKLRIKRSKRSLNLRNLPSKLIRLESDARPARTGKVRVTLYPSDSFLRFGAAVLARDLDLHVAK